MDAHSTSCREISIERGRADFLSCDEYAPVKAIRNNHAKTTMIIIDGL